MLAPHNMRQIGRFGRNLLPRRPYVLLLGGLLAAMAGLGLGRTFLGSVCLVDGTSMAPTYQSGTWVYSSPISTPLERGDIVLIDDGSQDYAVKRVIGLPGETVHIWHGFVFVNRTVLREPYVPKCVYTYTKKLGVFILGEGQYVVLGDNRLNSIDSRTYGAVARKQIKRRVPLPENTVRAHFDDYELPAYLSPGFGQKGRVWLGSSPPRAATNLLGRKVRGKPVVAS